ncbi:MAG: type IV secretion system protein [Alphaproteobacteria bacterium]|nr:type IV secretion system protein [Alphaproteobacteria bacterium]
MRSVDERRYLWILRTHGFFFFLVAIALIILVFAYERIQPGVKYEAFLVEGNTSADTVSVIRAPRTLAPGQLGNTIARNMIINYVETRESLIPEREMARVLFGRASDLRLQTAPEAWEEFASSSEFQARIRPRGDIKMIATVDVPKIRFMPNREIFEVPVNIEATSLNSEETKTISKTIEIKVEFEQGEQQRTGEQAWRNPLGFRVVSYRAI